MVKNKLDWSMAIIFDFAIGLTILQPTNQITASAGSLLTQYPEWVWGVVLLALGLVRVAALLINGHWNSSKSAAIRGVASVFSLGFWGLMFYVVARPFLSGFGGWGTFTTIIFGIMLCNLFCCVVAGYDYSRLRKPKPATHSPMSAANL